MAPRRPTAFDVSFPDEAPLDAPVKRKIDVGINNRMGKRSMVDGPDTVGLRRIAYYRPRAHEELETTPGLVVPGEDPEAVIDRRDAKNKPIRMLTEFSIFDVNHDYAMVTLDEIEHGMGRRIEATGYAMAVILNEEDAGQEDEGDEEVLLMRLGKIKRYKIDYGQLDDPLQIETDRAWYQLRIPSPAYEKTFQYFYRPHRIAQLVMSSARTHPNRSYDEFVAWFTTFRDPAMSPFEETDLLHAVPCIISVLSSREDGPALSSLPFLEHLLALETNIAAVRPLRQRNAPVLYPRPLPLVGNLDVAVLRPDMQNPTHVTPLIASLAAGLIREQLVVVGPRPGPGVDQTAHKREARAKLRRLLEKPKRRTAVEFQPTERLKRTSVFYRSVHLNGIKYTVGDYVLVRKESDIMSIHPVLSDHAAIPDYFWFGKIIFINSDTEKVHLQWLSHGSTTHLEDIYDPQELFLTDLCDPVDIADIADPVIVHRCSNLPVPTFPHGEYFYKLVYDEFTGSFQHIDNTRRQVEARAAVDEPPNNCPVCLLFEEQNQKAAPYAVELGVAIRGLEYHLWDFVLFYGRNGPCEIGYITDICFPKSHRSGTLTTVQVKRVGRIIDLANVLPSTELKDEQHLFMTDESLTLNAEDLIRVCYVWPSMGFGADDLLAWLSLSTDHFFMKFQFPTLTPKSWAEKKLLGSLKLCEMCSTAKAKWWKLMTQFLAEKKQHPLRILDLFAGSGAFGLAMEETGCVKVTHAVEISPSAAETLRRASPNTVVYNQCTNIVLRYIIKSDSGHIIETPNDIPDESPIPPPFKPKDIDCIIAGFPCQPHSSLNMFKRADDPKSNAILNALAYVDFIRPKWVVFENVRGFLQFNLNATQAGRHKVEGGVQMGGLKLLESGLIKMGYQVQATLLQSGHYGAPQSRIRFFLFAALIGYPLPSIPQPTHDFPHPDHLVIHFPNGQTTQTVLTMRGTAPRPFVNIDDAIGDLLRFDWSDPLAGRRNKAGTRKVRDPYGQTIKIRAIECDKESKHWGYEGIVPYLKEPNNNFQARCRRKQTEDLQQYTRILLPSKVQRVVNIPLESLADYRSLPPHLWSEWQFSDPESAVARNGLRPGLYGRLDKNGYFPTTVTNVEPTAKQCRVINPYCKRMVTVRELARSQGFPDWVFFHSRSGDVLTMHRQIGNAVSWPVALAIGMSLRDAMFSEWKNQRENFEQLH